MAAAGVTGLGALDVLLLHAVNHRARGKRLADICLVMNIEDRHVAAYALKKLVRQGLVEATRRGHETRYATTARGDEACLRYRRVREECLVRSLSWLDEHERSVGSAASFLHAMTALYEQAERQVTVTAELPDTLAPLSR
ncbi:MAG TPA: winged helix DNA-binding protein [Candidatus Binatia bacterium]|nr:winged helix DNA-binding protein [Candidatus Binatia bacterium]